MREVLDAAKATALNSLESPQCVPPHYVFSYEGELFQVFAQAAKTIGVRTESLWDEWLGVYDALYGRYHYKRIEDALFELHRLPPFSEEAKQHVDDIAEELREVELLQPGALRRRKGTTRLKQRSIAPGLFVSKEPSYVRVGKKRYPFSAYEQWCVIDRILRILYRHYNERFYDEPECPVRISSAEINRFHGKEREFIDRYIRRRLKPIGVRRNNREMDDDAAIAYDLLEKDMAE